MRKKEEAVVIRALLRWWAEVYSYSYFAHSFRTVCAFFFRVLQLYSTRYRYAAVYRTWYLVPYGFLDGVGVWCAFFLRLAFPPPFPAI